MVSSLTALGPLDIFTHDSFSLSLSLFACSFSSVFSFFFVSNAQEYCRKSYTILQLIQYYKLGNRLSLQYSDGINCLTDRKLNEVFDREISWPLYCLWSLSDDVPNLYKYRRKLFIYSTARIHQPRSNSAQIESRLTLESNHFSYSPSRINRNVGSNSAEMTRFEPRF